MTAPYPQFVLFGDSLLQESTQTQEGFAFQAALQAHCVRRLDVINRGLSGWNTKNAVEYLEQMFPLPTSSSPKMNYILILLGANDACMELPTTAQHVPLADYKANLTKIVTHPNILAHNPKIILVTPPPVDQIKLTVRDVANGHPSVTRTLPISATYSQTARDVAKENPGIILIDLWQGIMDQAIAMAPGDYQQGGPYLGTPENGKQGGLDVLLRDGLHMSGEGYRVFLKLVLPHVGQEWAESTDENNIGFVFPPWRKINPRTQ